MALAQHATIKRVSDKPRNLKNQANNVEMVIIKGFKKSIANGQEYKPVIKVVNDEVSFYYPITTNSMCLQCHGNPTKDIDPKVLTALTTFYPTDKATGYAINEVRGVWNITYKQQ
jgi:nitrate reductase cytochrome c-type subunit